MQVIRKALDYALLNGTKADVLGLTITSMLRDLGIGNVVMGVESHPTNQTIITMEAVKAQIIDIDELHSLRKAQEWFEANKGAMEWDKKRVNDLQNQLEKQQDKLSLAFKRIEDLELPWYKKLWYKLKEKRLDKRD